jgi:putative ABC transport system permease protein
MIRNFFKITWRNLWRNKTFSFLNLFGLACGVTCAGLIFLWVEDELNYDHNHMKRDRLYKVLANHVFDGKTHTFGFTPGLLASAMKDEIPGAKNTCRLTWDQYTLFSIGDKAFYERGYYADSTIFSMFTLPFVRGSHTKVFEQLYSLVISEKMAKKFFGERKDIVGKTLKVNNEREYVITGVMKDVPENSTFRFDWLAPFEVYQNANEWLKNWNNNGIQTFVELHPTVKASAYDKKLNSFIKQKDTSATARPFLFSMNDWRLYNKFEDGKQAHGGRIQYVRMFTIIAWVILFIACINFMNLATARSEKMAREIGVRKVLGAGRKILLLRFIGESMSMSFFSVMLAVLIMRLLLPSFNLLVDKNLEIGLNQPLHIAALFTIAIICGLVAGSYPAFYLSSFRPVGVLKGLNPTGPAQELTRKGLVISQFTISIGLIIATIIIYLQVQHVMNRDIGYNKANLIQTAVRGDMHNKFPVIKEELFSTGYIENAALSNLNMLYMGSQSGAFDWEGKDPTKDFLVTVDWVSPEYIQTLGVQIIKGRDFYRQAKQDSSSVIINETFAKLLDKDNVVGRVLKHDSVNYTIVGVVRDFVFSDMYAKSDPLAFFCYPEYFGYIYIRFKPQKKLDQAIAKTETIVKKHNPAYPFNYTFVDEEFNRLFKSEMLIGKLSRLFAMLAILISCLGLFGLAAYTAERRTKEIGIRKVLGASVQGVVALLSKDFLKLVGIAILIATPLAWWFMHNWLQDFAYRINISWWVFFAAGIIALVIAFFTVSYQAIKAAVANPVRSLRTE